MRTDSQLRARQTVGGASIAVVAVFSLFWLSRKQSNPHEDRILRPKDHYELTLIDEQEAAPGKLISGPSSAYFCKPEDAAVAVVKVTDLDSKTPDIGNPLGSIRIENAVDSEGNQYDVAVHRTTDTFFIRIQKGFQKPPKRLVFQAEFLPNGSPLTKATVSVPFTKIAPPVRQFAAPSDAERRASEKLAIAEYVEDHHFLNLKIVQKTPPGDYLEYHLQATPFSSPGFARGDGQDLSQPSAYSASANAVKVRIDRFRRAYDQSTLTYKNAAVSSIGGHRYLVLPAPQIVGAIDGCTAILLKDDGAVFRKLHTQRSHGEVRIQLLQQLAGFPDITYGALSCAGVSPSLKAMGLEWINVNVDRYQLNQVLTGSPSGGDQSQSMKIPELKLRFRLRNDVKVGSTTLILPIHHVKQDLALFPPIHVIRGGAFHIGTGAGRPLPNPED